jgi:small ubiquitin-related modifier
MSSENENGSPNAERNDAPAAAPAEHLNIKVTDNNNEVFFKIKRSTKLEKLMTAFCDRQGKTLSSVRFLFEGQRVQPTDTPDTVSSILSSPTPVERRRPLTLCQS